MDALCLHLLLLSWMSFTYPENGIYLTSTDYQKHHLSYAYDSHQNGYSIRQGFLNASFYRIQTPDTTFNLPASQIWGLRQQGKDLRLLATGDSYEVSALGPLWLYSSQMTGNSYAFTQFYFSTSLDTQPVDLNRNQLKKAFTSSSDFIKALEKWPRRKSLVLFLKTYFQNTP